MYTIELKSVRKTYGQFVAVDNLSFNIEQGAVFGLLGPNGAGKTSTIRMMIGITLPDSGSVSMFGRPFDRHHLSQVGYLPAERALYRRMTALENLVFLGQLKQLSARDATARTHQLTRR